MNKCFVKVLETSIDNSAPYFNRMMIVYESNNTGLQISISSLAPSEGEILFEVKEGEFSIADSVITPIKRYISFSSVSAAKAKITGTEYISDYRAGNKYQYKEDGSRVTISDFGTFPLISNIEISTGDLGKFVEETAVYNENDYVTLKKGGSNSIIWYNLLGRNLHDYNSNIQLMTVDLSSNIVHVYIGSTSGELIADYNKTTKQWTLYMS